MSRSLVFAVDGQKVEIRAPDPTLSLADFLRSSGRTSAKIGCGEGGCGACSVAVASWDAAAGKATYRTVNACLMALCSCDGLAVTTSYGLGNSVKGFHPIQESLAQHNGSQCGFCSPGMVMSLFGMLSQHPGETCPNEKKIESCIDGNLCRCTGYRSILTAFQSFAGQPKDNVAGEKWAPFPEFLKGRGSTPENVVTYDGSDKEWVIPGSLSDLFTVLQQNAMRTDVTTSMVAGHTCRGVYKDDHKIDVIVDITRVPELQSVEVTPTGIEFGGAITWSRFIHVLGEVMEEGKPEHEVLKVLVEHAEKVAGHSVRNLGTLGGNLVMTKERGFQSDLATMLAGAGAVVTVAESKAVESDVGLDVFFTAAYQIPDRSVLTRVKVPFLQPGEVFRSYRTAVRPVNSHALTNAAFAVKVEAGTVQSSRLVVGALGSRGAAPGPNAPETSTGTPGYPLRAAKTEESIQGRAVGQEALAAALAALPTEDWWPEDAFERHLALGYMYKMFHTLVGTDNLAGPPQGVSLSSERTATSGTQLVTWCQPALAPIAEAMPKTSSWRQAAGEQTYTSDIPDPHTTLYAAYVTVPRAKAVFVSADLTEAEQMPGYFGVLSAEDIPGANMGDLARSHTLLVPKGKPSQYAGHPCLLLLADTTKHAEAAARAVRVQTEATEELANLTIDACIKRQLADKGADEPPAFLRRSTTIQFKSMMADKARAAAAVEACKGPGALEKPVYKREAFATKRGDADAGLASAPRTVLGHASVGGQKPFYMECQSALAVPGEDNTLAVWGTYQVPSWAHAALAACTSLPQHKIVVNATHIGGGFGGKLTKFHPTIAASVAASVTKRPVRMAINRNVDTVMSGGRHEWEFEYEAGFDENSKLRALKVIADSDGGQGDACCGFNLMILCKNVEQIYAIPDLEIVANNCITDKPGNTAVRGPGEPEAIFLIETVLEHVACELGKSTQEVREVNIFTSLADMDKVAADPTSPDVDQYSALLQVAQAQPDGKCASGVLKGFPALGIWTSLKKKVDFDRMATEVEAFNADHRWRKRGLAMTPVKYAVQIRAQQATLCAYPDGTILITVDATEIGQGLHTKVIQYASHYLSQVVPGCEVPMKDIRIGPNGTDKVAVGSLTGGSTSSEGVCEAVRQAIDRLAEVFKPHQEKLAAAGKEVTFKAVADAAKSGDELQFSGKCMQDGEGYHCYGAAVSQVEVDVLTGESCILSSSLLYDCGKSLNPTIDLGQCEGAFMMGVGYYLREKVVCDSATGVMHSDGTWEYKIPCYQDVPLKFDVEFFPRAFNEGGIQSSKASGEPPLVLACSVFMAVKQAVRAGRLEFGKSGGHFRLDAPATPRDIALAIGATDEMMMLA